MDGLQNLQAVIPGYYLDIKPLKMLNNFPQPSFCKSLGEHFGKSWNSLDGIKFCICKAHPDFKPCFLLLTRINYDLCGSQCAFPNILIPYKFYIFPSLCQCSLFPPMEIFFLTYPK